MSAFLFLIIMGVVAADASASRASVSKVYGKNSKVMQNTFGIRISRFRRQWEPMPRLL